MDTTKRKSPQMIGRHSNRVRLNVWIMAGQGRELDRLCAVLDIAKTDAVTEAIQYWLNAQYRMGVK